MIFNFTHNYNFTTRLSLNEKNIEVIKSTKLLGTIISDNLKWDENTRYLVQKANARMQLLTKVAGFGANREDLKAVFITFVRSVLEQSSVVWHTSLSLENSEDLERIQKSAMKILMKNEYKGYESSLRQLDLMKLSDRRDDLLLKYGLNCLKNEKTKHIFPQHKKTHNMTCRNMKTFSEQRCFTSRLQNSTIPQLQKRLNQYFNEKQIS